MKVFVTGGTGYIGSHTCVELLNAGHDVVIADNFYNSCPEVLNRIKELTGREVKFYECDIRDRAALDKIFAENDIDEIIMATNPDTEGEATAMYISRLLKPFNIRVSRLAYGIPVGSNLEFADDATLNRAIEGRTEM